MPRNIFIYTDEARSGKSMISFSLIKCFRAIYPRVGFYRPIVDHEQDLHIESAKSYLDIDTDKNVMQGIKLAEISKLIRELEYNKIFQIIDKNYQILSKSHDIIICDGAVLPSTILAFNPNINLEIANNLDCEVITIINAHNKSIQEIIDNVISKCYLLKKNGCRALGIIINRALETQIASINEKLKNQKLDCPIIGVIPENSKLSKPSVLDIKSLLGAEVIAGEDQLSRPVHNQIIAAKQTSNFLASNHTKENSLVVTPGDRNDILLACILADQSKTYPKISGIVLTAGFSTPEIIKQILEGIVNCPPILWTNTSTFIVAEMLAKAHYATAISSKEKIDNACLHVLNNIDQELITSEASTEQYEPTNRHMLQNFLLTKAKTQKKHIVLPEGEDIRVMTAAAKLIALDAAEVTLIGDSEQLGAIAETNNIDLSHIHIKNPNIDQDKELYAKHLYEKRKHKNMTINIARDMIQDPIMYATCMVDMGLADGMVSGATHTTSDTVRPALQIIKSKPGQPFVCSIFVMCMQDKVVIYGDCALSINPNAEQLAHIATNAANMAQILNLKPKVALLSYSSGGSGHGASVDKVREATNMVISSNPELAIAGPIQYDAAVDPNIGKRKLPNNPVAGQANVLVFPDLDTGNNTYKAVQREAKGLAIGPILLGLNKPINDLSRGCDANEIFMTALITIIQAQGK